ncbi:translation initiation factor IF-2-like [Leopardus geoffroyi]|uniref:translation initiation factor IF-2-like n=1 Tax=Leopardus geoffroyi TaxID=46844 RepID=UPI001E262218|nr:translation initiation factor IF-2-like [Leopardus geoffroyi]
MDKNGRNASRREVDSESRFKEDIVTAAREATSSLNLSLCVCKMGSMGPGSLAGGCDATSWGQGWCEVFRTLPEFGAEPGVRRARRPCGPGLNPAPAPQPGHEAAPGAGGGSGGASPGRGGRRAGPGSRRGPGSGGPRGGTKRPAAAVLKIPRKWIWAGAQGVTTREGARASEQGGGGRRGARGAGRPQTSPASSGKSAGGGGGGGMGGPAPPGCDPADPPLGAPPPQPGARAGGA